MQTEWDLHPFCHITVTKTRNMYTQKVFISTKKLLMAVLGLYLSIKQKQQLVHFLLQSGCCQISNKYRPTFEGRVLQISVMGPVIYQRTFNIIGVVPFISGSRQLHKWCVN